MAATRTEVVRTLVAVVTAVGLAGVAWPIGVVAVGFGFGLMTSGFFGEPDLPAGLFLVLVGMMLLAAPVVLASLVVRRSHSVTGWVVGAGWLLVSGVFISMAAAGGFVTGWFMLPDV